MAITSNYNIKQVTNFDVENSSAVTTHTISIPEKQNDGSLIFVGKEIEYVYALVDLEILKLGYCCEPKGILYPIYLQVGDNYKPFIIGKNGMYEFQPENYISNDNEEMVTDVIVRGVQVPKNIRFTLDYVLSIT